MPLMINSQLGGHGKRALKVQKIFKKINIYKTNCFWNQKIIT